MTGRVLLRGGRVLTPSDPTTTSMLVVDDRVVWVGDEDGADGRLDGADRVVHLDGALVTPAFVDAHVHATSTGLTLSGLDLTGTRSATELLDAVERRVRELPGVVVLGHGWDESTWADPAPPDREAIDRASSGALVYLSRIDVHSALASSALLAQVPDAKALEGYDDSGLLRTHAHHAVRRAALASVPAAQREQAQRLTRSHAAAQGIAAFHEIAGPDVSGEDDLSGLLAMADAEPGPEVVGYWGQTAVDGGLDVVARLGLAGAAGDLFVDGALGSRTACLHGPYADAPDERGMLYLTADEVAEHVVACTHAGVQAGFHVIGDAAVAAVVTGLRRAEQVVGAAALRERRHRLEHVEMVTAGQRAVLAELGVTASVQPVFDALWGIGSGPDGPGMYEARLGERAQWLNPFAGLVRDGVPLALGSDAPVTPLGPWAAVRAAVLHRTTASRLSSRAAFAAHTRGGWKAARVDDAGTLAPGMLASYAVWHLDELAGTGTLPVLAADVPLPVCVRTVARGTVVHDSGALQEVAA